MAKTYKAKTKDFEVSDISIVQVEASEMKDVKEVLTLAYLNTRIAGLTADISNLQTQKAGIEAIRAEVEKEALKVKLKETEPE